MDVILLERVEKLGQMGDTVSVRAGYARNFLLPQGKALRATNANRELFEKERARLEAENLARKEEAEAVAAKMAGLKVVLIRAAGESGQLYGSVTSRDIAGAVTDAGASIARSQVQLNRAIKALGLYEIDLRLHPEVTVAVTVNIARSEDEAEAQFETGGALIVDRNAPLDGEDDVALDDADESEAAEGAAEGDAETAETDDAETTEN